MIDRLKISPSFFYYTKYKINYNIIFNKVDFAEKMTKKNHASFEMVHHAIECRLEKRRNYPLMGEKKQDLKGSSEATGGCAHEQSKPRSLNLKGHRNLQRQGGQADQANYATDQEIPVYPLLSFDRNYFFHPFLFCCLVLGGGVLFWMEIRNPP